MQPIALVADDDHPTLSFMEQALRPTGFQVITVADGRDALEALHDVTPRIIFLDLLMPRTSGFDVLAYISQTPRLRHTYVVILSAHHYFEPVPEIARADLYLLKPVRAKQVREAALSALSGQATNSL